MIGTSTKFNKIGDKKRRKPPIHLTTYRGWEYSGLRRWIKFQRKKERRNNCDFFVKTIDNAVVCGIFNKC